MNLKLSGVGAEPRKVGLLVGLGAIAGFVYLSNRTSDGSSSPAPAPAQLGPAGDCRGRRPAGRPFRRKSRAKEPEFARV